MAQQQQQQLLQQGQTYVRTPLFRPFDTIAPQHWQTTISGLSDDKILSLILSAENELDKVSNAQAETDENIDVDLRQLQYLLKLLLEEKESRRQGGGIPLVALAAMARQFRGHL